MRRTRATLAVFASLLCVALLSAPGASAGPKEPAGGTIAVDSNVVNSTHPAGRNTKVDATAQVTYSGTLAGTAREDYDQITLVNGNVRLHGVGAFTGTIDGRTGTLSYVFHGDADSGTIIITGGMGGLAGAHGTLPYELTGTVYTYGGSVWFT